MIRSEGMVIHRQMLRAGFKFRFASMVQSATGARKPILRTTAKDIGLRGMETGGGGGAKFPKQSVVVSLWGTAGSVEPGF